MPRRHPEGVLFLGCVPGVPGASGPTGVGVDGCDVPPLVSSEQPTEVLPRVSERGALVDSHFAFSSSRKGVKIARLRSKTTCFSSVPQVPLWGTKLVERWRRLL